MVEKPLPLFNIVYQKNRCIAVLGNKERKRQVFREILSRALSPLKKEGDDKAFAKNHWPHH
jgi:hypothetical protein